MQAAGRRPPAVDAPAVVMKAGQRANGPFKRRIGRNARPAEPGPHLRSLTVEVGIAPVVIDGEDRGFGPPVGFDKIKRIELITSLKMTSKRF